MNREQRNDEILICIGAQKAGTTWLYKCLCEHPMITSAVEKELHYFSEKFHSYDTEVYLEKLNETNPGKKPFECSTSYLSSSDAALNIKRAFPKAKIVAVLRNPVDRLTSHMRHLQSKNRKGCGSVEECAKNFPEIIHNGLYGKNLESYFQNFDNSKILIIFYEELSTKPQESLDKICDFYNLPRFKPQILGKRYHSSKSRSHWAYMWIARRYRRNKDKYLFSKLVKTLKFVGINGVMIDNILSKKSSRLPKEKLNEDSLKIYFRDDLKKLEELTGSIPLEWLRTER